MSGQGGKPPKSEEGDDRSESGTKRGGLGTGTMFKRAGRGGVRVNRLDGRTLVRERWGRRVGGRKLGNKRAAGRTKPLAIK